MENEEFELKNERKAIPAILLTNWKVTAYREGVINCLELVAEQDKEFIKRLKSEIFKQEMKP